MVTKRSLCTRLHRDDVLIFKVWGLKGKGVFEEAELGCLWFAKKKKYTCSSEVAVK